MVKIGILHDYSPTAECPNQPVAALAWDDHTQAVAVAWLRTGASVGPEPIDYSWVIQHLDPTTIWIEELGEGAPFDPLEIQAEQCARRILVSKANP